MKSNKYLVSIMLLLTVVLSSCIFPFTASTPTDTPEPVKKVEAKQEEKKEEPTATTEPSPTPTQINLGPSEYPQGVNPLNGLPVTDPESLKNPPVLVSISNFPPTARPQSGLTFCPIIFELWIGEGMTRFLCIFYGDYPPEAAEEYDQDDPILEVSAGTIGPIRSGRLPYESIRQLFNGYLVMASAAKNVSQELNDYTNIFGSDGSDPNSAMIDVGDLEGISKSTEDEILGAALSGMYFDETPPEGGRTANSLWLFYSYLNQIFWRYDEESGSFLRWQDDADASTFVQATDRLNGASVAASNVIVLFAEHDVHAATVIDINLLYTKRGKALVFRDGEMHEVYWSTASEEYEKTTGKLRPIRFVDAQGNPFPLKPGQTWVEIVPQFTPYWETVDDVIFNRLANGNKPGSGFWAVRVYAPK